IPFYCYHSRLSIAANCRMCLVEVSNSPKLVPACQTALAEGVQVKTVTPKVKSAQRSTMEFLLLNHPVDCSICDQSGECKLQDYYVRYNWKPSRLEGTKVLKNKRKVLGPTVVLDQERCILCTRCVRFMSEVAKEPQLGVFGRGSHETIDTFAEGGLTSNYSGNTVDICPVGALLSRDFRFRARAWFLSSAPSICTGCSRGCNINADFFGQDTYRYRPRENEQVNKIWMCDQGRVSYKYLNRDRVTHARAGLGVDARDATREEAVAAAANRLKGLAGSPGLVAIASPLASNEDLLATLHFTQQALGIRTVYASGRPEGEGDHYLLTPDKNPNRKGLEWIARGLGLTLKPFSDLTDDIQAGRVTAAYAVGGELPVPWETFAHWAAKLQLLVVQAFNTGGLAAAAHVLLPASPHVEDEGSFVNVDGLIQRFRRAYPFKGESQPHWNWASDLFRALDQTIGFASARDAFRQLQDRVPELAAFDWDKQAPFPKSGKGIETQPSSADGRPPGYREYGVPRVRGI
ncbi:MAG TPA: molybdopterin-dependent oxidoreductase, partial [Myxococcaceae bacterium]|nr:molybdopterin-dependent oxidoreductase [Myxococcaceae bacterium]